jgi:hypothetical protein
MHELCALETVHVPLVLENGHQDVLGEAFPARDVVAVGEREQTLRTPVEQTQRALLAARLLVSPSLEQVRSVVFAARRREGRGREGVAADD